MRFFYFFYFLARTGVDSVDPERIFEDLEELASVQFWQDQAHVKCLVEALKEDRTSVTPSDLFETYSCLFKNQRSEDPSLRNLAPHLPVVDFAEIDNVAFSNSPTSQNWPMSDLGELQFLIEYFSTETLKFSHFNGSWESIFTPEVVVDINGVAKWIGRSTAGKIWNLSGFYGRIKRLLAYFDLNAVTYAVREIQSFTLFELAAQLGNVDYAEAISLNCFENPLSEAFISLVLNNTNSFEFAEFNALRDVINSDINDPQSNTIAVYAAEIVTGVLIGLTESVGLALEQETLMNLANTILFSLSSPDITLNEALSFLPKDVLLTGGFLFITNEENFAQLWKNFSNAVAKTSLLEWIEISLQLLPEFNFIIITLASAAAAFEVAAQIQEFYFTNPVFLSEELAQLQISSISGNATQLFPKVLCLFVLPELIPDFQSANLGVCDNEFQKQWQTQTWNSTLSRQTIFFFVDTLFADLSEFFDVELVAITRNINDVLCTVLGNCNPEHFLAFKAPELAVLFQNLTQELLQNVTQECLEDSKMLWFFLNNSQSRLPVLQLIDSWGKPPSGLLQGNTKLWGRADECLEVAIENIAGEYCLGTFPVALLGVVLPVELGVCVPDTCSDIDLNQIIQNGLEFTNNVLATIDELIKPFASINSTIKVSINLKEYFRCHERSTRKERTKNDPLWSLAIAIISIFSILCIVCTFLDLFFDYFMPSVNDLEIEISRKASKKEKNEIQGEENSAYSGEGELRQRKKEKYSVIEKPVTVRATVKMPPRRKEAPKQPFYRLFVGYFSFFKNTAKLLNTERGPRVIKSIDGIRAFSLSWVIWGHSIYYAAGEWDNLLFLEGAFVDPFYQHISNAIFAVDTFFMLSGFLTAYLLIKKFEKNSSCGFFAQLYAHRYFRITVVYLIIILLYMGLLGRYGIGARVHWRSDKLVKQCEDWWWRNILYVTNLIKNCDEKGDCRVNSCLGHSWYLSNDMQFFVFGVPLIFVLSKFPKVGLGVWISVLLANISYLIWVAVVKDVTTIQSSYVALSGPVYTAYWNLYYNPPWSRVGPYAVGVLGGWFLLYFRKTSRKINKWVMFGLWIFFASCSLGLVYGKIPMEKNPQKYINSPRDVMYVVFDRIIWAAAVFFVLFACETKSAGPVKSILEWRGFVVISKLSYVMYLLHPILQTSFYGNHLVSPPHMGDYISTLLFLGFFMMTFFASFLFHVVVEAPLMNLEKKLLS